MVRHLATVHLVLYVGVGMLFLATAWAAAQLVGEVWHAYSHLQFRPNPFPELAGFVGLAVVIVVTIVAGRGARGAAIERRLQRSPQGR